MFIDRAKIYIIAGNGGDGIVSFRREKNISLGGPDGGNGGHGGNVYIRANNNLKTLYDVYRHPHYKADRGSHAGSSRKNGKSAPDLYIDVPCGTQIYVLNTESYCRDARPGVSGDSRSSKKLISDLVNSKDKILVAKGGRGGRGNASFKTGIRTAPRIAEKGEPGEEETLLLELKMIADIGIIGLPNAGKSTFLSRVTKAKPKIADYPFTTLSPNLGMAEIDNERYILADIPGLIEGASIGVGLGDEFLRHVERSKVFIHLIDICGYEEKDIIENFKTINKELELYNKDLLKRKQVVGITKIDTIANRKDGPLTRLKNVTNKDNSKNEKQPNKRISEITKKIKSNKKVKVASVFPISSISGQGLQELLREAVKLLADYEDIDANIETKTYKEFIYEPEFTIEKKDNIYYVKGKKIEKLVKMTKFEEQEAFQRFQNILKKMGIEQELKRKGASSKDIIFISDMKMILDEDF